MKFNKDSRVKIPSIVHLSRLGFDFLSLNGTEWLSFFNGQKQKGQELKTEINLIDKEIDRMVYELYGLTEEEIKIVEEK